MNLSDLPTRVAIPFAASAGGGYIRPIPVNSQIGITAGAASFTDGFTPDTFTPLSGGGAYVNGEDMNGILNYVTRWSSWQAAGGAAVYNSAFATAIDGYPRGAVLSSSATDGLLWQSDVDGNLTDPDGGSAAGWVPVGPVAATLAQVVAGTSTSTFVSPATLSELFGFGAGDLASPGYIQIPLVIAGALRQVIVQWGQYNFTAEAAITITYPLEFPTACLWFDPGPLQTNNSSNEKNITFQAGGFTRSAYTAHVYANGDSNPMQCNWLAIGY